MLKVTTNDISTPTGLPRSHSHWQSALFLSALAPRFPPVSMQFPRLRLLPAEFPRLRWHNVPFNHNGLWRAITCYSTNGTNRDDNDTFNIDIQSSILIYKCPSNEQRRQRSKRSKLWWCFRIVKNKLLLSFLGSRVTRSYTSVLFSPSRHAYIGVPGLCSKATPLLCWQLKVTINEKLGIIHSILNS